MMFRIEITSHQAEIYDSIYTTYSMENEWCWSDRFKEGTEYGEEIDWKSEGF